MHGEATSCRVFKMSGIRTCLRQGRCRRGFTSAKTHVMSLGVLFELLSPARLLLPPSTSFHAQTEPPTPAPALAVAFTHCLLRRHQVKFGKRRKEHRPTLPSGYYTPPLLRAPSTFTSTTSPSPPPPSTRLHNHPTQPLASITASLQHHLHRATTPAALPLAHAPP